MRRIEHGNEPVSEVLSAINSREHRPDMQSSVHAEELFSTHGKTFYFAARFFPTSYRSAVVTLYEFFRTLDDLVDVRPQGWLSHGVREELDAWQQWFRNECISPAPREPLGTSLATLVQRYSIPVTLFHDFLDGMSFDLEPAKFQSFRDLYRYCYQVAGTVGLTMAHVIGARSEQAFTAARQLGIAMQLTNILRDVGSDLATGRLYLPADELVRFGSSPSHLYQLYHEQKLPDERFCALMHYQIDRARLYYAKGLHGIWLLPADCRLPVLLAGRLYQRILYEIERRQYDILHKRASTNLLTKVREAGAVFLLDRLWRYGEEEPTVEMGMFYED